MLKKFFIVLSLLVFSASSAFCVTNSELVRTGIAKYKAKNYAGCIYTMKDVIKKDPSNAMAHYYAAISYARLGDKAEATNYYTKVVNLNSNVTLTSYAKQGLAAINGGSQNNALNAQADKFLQAGYKSGVNPEVTKQLKMMELEKKKKEAIKNLQWVKNVINAYNTIPEYTTDSFKRIIKKLCFSFSS